ncbi:MAG TPA: hypothetical protein PLX89_21200 [Verrucomicrobiota bacterium]|nr:hypothetical protein [Verrucomicrobiota bacterium]
MQSKLRVLFPALFLKRFRRLVAWRDTSRLQGPWHSRSQIVLLILAGVLYATWLRAADVLPQLAQLLVTSDDPQVQLDVLRGINAALQGRRSVPMPAGWPAVETKLATNSNTEVRALAQTLSLTFGSVGARANLRALASNKQADVAARRTAIESLLNVRDPELPALLQRLLSDPTVSGAAVRGLAVYDDAGTPAAILAVYPKLATSEKRDALNTLASRATYAHPLLGAVAAGTVPKGELTADLVRQLRSLKDDAIRSQITELWGVMNETSPDMQAEIDRTKRMYWAGGSQPGDAPRGRVIYNRVCAQCHHLFDHGGAVGPDITGANRTDLDYLLQNILFPNAVIPNEYRASTFEVNDGRVVMGVLKQTDGTAYRVQTATELVTLPRNEVAKVEQSNQSMMPEGLLAPLKEQEVRDLLYYLSRPGQVPLPTEAK